MTKDEELDVLVSLLVELYDPERIVLFGSHARGDAGPDSDFDLLVVVPDDASEERRDAGRAYQESFRRRLGLQTPKDILVQTEKQAAWGRSVIGALSHTIAEEGVELYGRSADRARRRLAASRDR